MARESGVRRVGVSRWKRAWGSLRLRLAVWNAIAVIVTAVLTLIVLRQSLKWAMIRELDGVLREDANEIALIVRDAPADGLEKVQDVLLRKAEGHRGHGWHVLLRDADGKLIWSSRGAKTATIADQSGSQQRAVVRELSEQPMGVKQIVVGERMDLLHAEIARIDWLAGITALIVMMGAPPGAYWLAGRAANAVGQITRAASRLRPDHLDERLPIRGTGDELDRLAQTINGLLDRTGVYLERKRDILANAAHELRTPLAAIRSSVEVALNGDRSVEEYQELLADVIDQSGSLETLLNQLLLLAETEAEYLTTQVEPVSLDLLVAKSTAMFHGVAESKEIVLATPQVDDCRVAGNRLHLWQVVNNLIDNALKYTPRGGHVVVTLVADTSGGFAEMTVSDTGRGIAADDLPRVFERFFRVDRARTREKSISGAGLGLSICKAVTEAHGGTIECRSRLGEGTEFIVRLPLLESSDAAAPNRAMGTLIH